jgi:hypothetical protein
MHDIIVSREGHRNAQDSGGRKEVDNMIDKIGGIEESREGKEAGASQYAGSVYGGQGIQGIQPPVEAGKAQETQGIDKIGDKVSISEKEKVGGSSNLDALKGSLNANAAQGFNQGVQPSFAMNSVQGVQAGLEPGLQKAGVFKSPYEG